MILKATLNERTTTLVTLLLCFMLVPVLNGCFVSKWGLGNPHPQPKSAVEPGTEVNNQGRLIDLTTQLKKVPGVTVSGTGPGAVVTIRGSELGTFYGNPTPLFVVDGISLETSYSQVYHMISGTQFRKVTVLKGADASIYGVRGGNGVIVIDTD